MASNFWLKRKTLSYTQAFQSLFDKNIKFTIDAFPDGLTFLDIKMDNIQTDIYCKPIYTGLYVSFHNQISSRPKSAWIKALLH